MSLFKPEDIASTENKDEKQPAAHGFKPGKNVFAMGRKGVKLSDLLPEINKNHAYHIPSLGNWSTHDMLQHILSLTGPAEVFITTWSIKKRAVEIILDLQANNQITKFTAVFDNRVKAQCPDAWQLAQNNFQNTFLTKIHAKTVIIKNKRYHISIITTANFTYNPRVEVYTITENEALSNYHLSWLIPLSEGAKPFLQ